jgi:GNAT superfamily N-acetyltransferase/biotin carboxyl carrier protein
MAMYIEELKELQLYNRDFYAPIEKSNKNKGSCVFLLTPNKEGSISLMNSPKMTNPNWFRGYYMERDIDLIINQKGQVTENVEVLNEASNKNKLLFPIRKAPQGTELFCINTHVLNLSAMAGITAGLGVSLMILHNTLTLRNIARFAKIMAPIVALSAIPQINAIDIMAIDTKTDRSHFKDDPKKAKDYYINGVDVSAIADGVVIRTKESVKDAFDLNVLDQTLKFAQLAYFGTYNDVEGNFIVIAHDDGSFSLYAHLAGGSIKVKEGQKVKAGQVIAKVGNTGNSTQPHLHFEYLKYAPDILAKHNLAVSVPLEGFEDYEYIPFTASKNSVKSTVELVEGIINKKDFSKTWKKDTSGKIHPCCLIRPKGKVPIRESVLHEDKLKASERTDFGLPEDKKYPMPDKAHVLSAIKFFNYVDPSKEKTLARNINKKIKEYNMRDEVNVGEKNRFSKYFKESALLEKASFEDTVEVYNSLSSIEKKYIAPDGTFDDSPYLAYRKVEYYNKKPIGFIELYRERDDASIALAVKKEFRKKGIAKKLMNNAIDWAKQNKLNNLLYKVETDNFKSIQLAKSFNGDLLDKDHEFYWYTIKLNDEVKAEVNIYVPEDGYIFNEDYAMTKGNLIVFNEANPKFNPKLKNILFKQRIKTNQELMQWYETVQEKVPYISRTYANLDLYKQYNIFVDFSYYSELFLKVDSPLMKKDKGLEFYFDFVDRFISDSRYLLAGYTKRTVFIPVDGWKVEENSDIWDYTKNINPISLIYRYTRQGRLELARNWNSMDFVFIGKNGFFKVRMEHLTSKTLTKFISCIKKLVNNERIIDDTKDSSTDIATDVIDNLETMSGIKIHNFTGTNKKLSRDELMDKAQNAIHSGSDEERKDALVAIIKNRADDSKDASEAIKNLEQDAFAKELISSLTYDSETGINFSATRRARLNDLNDKFLHKSINGKSVEELLAASRINNEIPKSDIPIESLDDQWKGLTFNNFEKAYNINEDIMAILACFADKSLPMAVRNVEREDISTSEDLLWLYKIEFEDGFGKRFKMEVEVPKFRDGKYMRLRGNDKIISNQLILLPIIKTDEDTAQVVSNYNKIFIRRYGTTTGKSCIASDRLHKALKKYIEAGNTKIKIRTGDNSRISSKYELPIDYVDLSCAYTSIEGSSFKFYFDQEELMRECPEFFKGKNHPLILGWQKRGNEKEPIIWTIGDHFCTLAIAPYLENEDPAFRQIYENTSEAAKYTYSKASILSTEIPLIVVMAYSEGLQTSLKKANIGYAIVDKRQKYDNNYEDVIKFKDGYLYYKLDYNSSLLMNGLKECNTEDYSISEINNKRMWLDFLDLFGGRILADGLDNFYDLMIDPITLNILKDCNLPTDYVSVLAYANNLLADNKYNRHIDITGNRMRSNEIIAGYFYKAISKAYGDYQRQIKRNRKEATFSMKRSAVVDLVFLDPTESDASVINPILDVEAASACSFKGLSGMNSDRSYGLDKRTYDDSMLNVLAMSTGFAANVGLTRWATINSAIAGKRGYIKKTDPSKMNDVDTLSMTEALTPFGTTSDDSMRVAMTFIQTSKHSMRVNKGRPLLITNGADEALPYLSSNTFSFKASFDGVVKEATDDYIIIEYKSKSGAVPAEKPYDFIDLREKIKKNSDGGYFEVLKLSPCVKKGQKIKAGQILAYDKLAYSNEFSTGDNLAYNVGPLAKLAILVTDEGFEDSAIIDDDLSEMMASDIVILKDLFLEKGSNVYSMVKKGQPVQEGDPLIIFQNAFDAEDANALIKNLSADQDEINEIGRVTLKSKVTGIVQDIKMYRTVELNELSPSLKKIFKEYESNINKTKSVMNKYHINTATYDSSSKLDATGKLKKAEGKVLIEFYLKYHDKMGVGDKLVYYAALKGVVKGIFPKGQEPYTDRRPKEKIRTFLTASSISKRMVGSIIKAGAIQKVIVELDRAVKDIYGIKYPDNIV